ncbi:hypothetical protein NDU88_005618 [Pleurodeles waltl]|uniref:Uncharacterized protein n=1 Tax=Pleurodeles waltl TaxID=8319 RepID=A0AAV7M9V9_PLEWA|nr:hypothetical protein NDU88_005618 [Pleurodeles waltl]
MEGSEEDKARGERDTEEIARRRTEEDYRSERKRRDAEDAERDGEDAGTEKASGRGSGEAEPVWETRQQPGEEETQRRTETTCHIQGGTWLMQAIANVM